MARLQIQTTDGTKVSSAEGAIGTILALLGQPENRNSQVLVKRDEIEKMAKNKEFTNIKIGKSALKFGSDIKVLSAPFWSIEYEQQNCNDDMVIVRRIFLYGKQIFAEDSKHNGEIILELFS